MCVSERDLALAAPVFSMYICLCISLSVVVGNRDLSASVYPSRVGVLLPGFVWLRSAGPLPRPVCL